MNGILLVDKPKGLTSHDIVHKLRKSLNIKKMGHAGTLDPDATGLLVLCLGKATKVSSLLMTEDKTYLVHFILGLESDTFDASGKTVAQKRVDIIQSDLLLAMKVFQGNIEQQVPRFSAVKVKGKRLYQYARRGESVTPPTRNIQIYSMKLRSFNGQSGEMEISCSKGTYVRSLIHDIGQHLDTGAITTDIRRTRCGALTIDCALSLDSLLGEDSQEVAFKALLPISKGLASLPQLQIDDVNLLPKILHGNGLRPQDFSGCHWNVAAQGTCEPVLVVGEHQEALAIGAFDGQSTLKVKRVL